MQAGLVETVDPMVRRLVAPNGGFMTGPGTNTYLVGHGEVALIDPGPDDDVHLEALVEEAGGHLRWILCTHTHPDHSPGAARLAQRTGAEVLAHSSRDGLVVDREVAGGAVIETDEFRLEVIHTPGHASNHLCFMLASTRLIFTGDHIVDGSTSVVLPPDGDMADYIDSLELVRDIAPGAIAPGHGGLIDEPEGVVEHYISHRKNRERQIVNFLADSEMAKVDDIVADLYSDVPVILHPMARQSVFAHMLKLLSDGVVSGESIEDGWTLL